MHRHLLTIAIALLACGAALRAQTCTTTWPYLYPDFQSGTVYLRGGAEQNLRLNIHMLRTALHYIEMGMIKEAVPLDIDSVRIGGDIFRYVDGVPMRVAAEGTSGYVAERLTADFASALEGSGAYGMPASTISKTDLSSLEVSGGANQNHMLLLQSKDQGKTAEIEGQYFLVSGTHAYPAVRKDVLEEVPQGRRESVAAFIKKHKIKWKRPDSLVLLADFLAEEEQQ